MRHPVVDCGNDALCEKVQLSLRSGVENLLWTKLVVTKVACAAPSRPCRRSPLAPGSVAPLLVAAVLLGIVGSVSSLRGQVSSPSEAQIKAAFLYNFAKFVEWPPEAFAEPISPIIIGVAGDESFEDILDHIVNDKMVQGRKLLVKRWKRNQSSHLYHILFIGAPESNALAEILQNIKGESVLTVGETDGFAQRGGVINFILSDNKVRFEINRKSAETVGLKISSKLLALAKTVWE